MAPLYQYSWLYAAVQPATGTAFWWELPALDTACFQLFLDQFGQVHADSFNILVLDNAPAHVARAVQPPGNVALVYLPPYCPELNPVERLWQALKRHLLHPQHPSPRRRPLRPNHHLATTRLPHRLPVLAEYQNTLMFRLIGII